MTVQEALRLAKRYPSMLISVLLTEFRYLSYQVATQLPSRGYSRESNPGPLAFRRANHYTKEE